MRIGIFIGTRPEIVSLSTLVNELARRKFSVFFFDVNEESGWFEKGLQYLTLDYPSPKKILKWGRYSELIDTIIKYIDKYELELLLVSGFSKTVLAAVEAFKLMDLPSIHFNSGIRTYMNEKGEILRQIIDRMSPFHMTILEMHKKNLIKEDFPVSQIESVGSLSTDAVLRNLTNAIKKSSILDELDVEENKYLVGYFNYIDSIEFYTKLSNFSDLKKSELIISIPKSVKKKLIHNESYYKIMEEHDVIFIEVLDFLDYLTLSYYSKGIITDSDWILLELAVFKKPTIYISKQPDFYGLENLGVIKRVSSDDDNLAEKLDKYIEFKPRQGVLPYLGNGESTERALEAIESFSIMKYTYPAQKISIRIDGNLRRIPLDQAKSMIW